MNDGQREPCSHGRIYGIAAGLKNLNSDLRGQLMNGDHHGMLCVHGARGTRCERGDSESQDKRKQRFLWRSHAGVARIWKYEDS